MISPVLGSVCLIFLGALIPIILSKAEIIYLDKYTNVVTPTLVFILILSLYLGLKVVGF